MLTFHLGDVSGYAIKYSPFHDARLAVAAAANFGLVGNGKLFILSLTDNGIVAERIYETNDALYNLAWAEHNENQLITGCGDGSVKLYDLTVEQFPVAEWREHTREVYGTSWNMVTKDTFLSSSWDGTIKLWSPHRPQSMLTLPTHSCTYSAEWSPHSPSVISCVSADSHLRIFDIRTPASASNHLVQLIPIHGQAPQIGHARSPQTPVMPPSECLSHDWNKYRPNVIATAGVDTIIRTFDNRNVQSGAVTMMKGHQYAVRRIAWSPHVSHILLSASYDMSARLWTDNNSIPAPRQAGAVQDGHQIGQMDFHTEFVTGVDWCLFGAEGWAATTAWDKMVCVWDAKQYMPHMPRA